jgi:hypothetical protein
MSVYEEIATASETWVEHQEKAKQVLEEIVTRFVDYCEIPSDRLRYLPWDEGKKLFAAKGDEVSSLSDACHYDKQAQEWGVGLSIAFAAPGTGPRAKVAFPVRVAPAGSDFMVRFGSLKPLTTASEAAKSSEEFFADAVGTLKSCFTTPNSRNENGFTVVLDFDDPEKDKVSEGNSSGKPEQDKTSAPASSPAP